MKLWGTDIKGGKEGTNRSIHAENWVCGCCEKEERWEHVTTEWNTDGNMDVFCHTCLRIIYEVSKYFGLSKKSRTIRNLQRR